MARAWSRDHIDALLASPAADSEHALLRVLVRMMAAGVTPMMVGPSGCGKSHLVGSTARMLGVPFHYSRAVEDSFSLYGFVNAMGVTTRTPFREAFEHGGVFLLDEVDAGSPELLDLVESAVLEMPPHVSSSPLPLDGYQVAGSSVCVPRAVIGHPLTFRGGCSDLTSTDVVTLLVNGSVPSYYPADRAANRGAALSWCVDEIERGGTRVELVVGFASDGHAAYDTRVTVKRAQDHLDLGAVAFSFAHAGLLRRLCFALKEQHRGAAWDVMMTRGYGMPAHCADDDCLVVPSAHRAGDWSTPQAALLSAQTMVSALLDGEQS